MIVPLIIPRAVLYSDDFYIRFFSFQSEFELGSLTPSPSTSLYLRLEHPNSVIRSGAVSRLTELAPNDDFSTDFLGEMICDRINDKDPDVIEMLLQKRAFIIKTLENDPLKRLVMDLLVNIYTKETGYWNRVEWLALEILAEVGRVAEWIPFFLVAVAGRYVRRENLELAYVTSNMHTLQV